MIELRKASHEDCAPFFIIYRQNIHFTKSKIKPTWFDHCIWWSSIFEKEDLYAILSNKMVIGYIRITKDTRIISIALAFRWQNKGIGTQALNLLNEKPLLARVYKNNKRSIHFFNKNNIKMELIE